MSGESAGKAFGFAGGVDDASGFSVDSLSSATAALEEMLEQKFDQASRRNEPGLAGLRIPSDLEDMNLYLERLAAMLEMIAETGLIVFSDQEIHRTIGAFLDACRQDKGGVFSSPQAAGNLKAGSGRFSEPEMPAVLWLTDVVWGAFRHTANPEFAANAVPILGPALEKIPRHDKTGLIGSEQPGQPKNVANFLFRPSLLFAQACHQMAEILNGLQEEGLADNWHYRGQQTEKNIRIYFWNKKLGMFRQSRAATDLVDVHGSALSVYRKTATSGQLMTIARQFSQNYDRLTDRGAILQFLSEENSSSDESPSASSFGGGPGAASFSSVAAGWFAYTLDFINSRLADHVMVEVARNLLTQESEGENADSEGAVSDVQSSVISSWDRIMAASRTVAASRAIQERRSLKQARAG